MGRIMRRIGTGSATQRVELGGLFVDNVEYEAINEGNFTGYILRQGKLRIIHLYNGAGEQTAISRQLGQIDFPKRNMQVGNWVLVDSNNNYGSRYLAIDTNGILTTSGTVVRGGFTLMYDAE